MGRSARRASRNSVSWSASQPASLRLFGWSFTQGIVIGATITVASTMVLARLLHDSGKMSSTFGRIMIGITLVEDVAVICMTVVLPVFSGSGEGRFAKAAWVLGKALILLIPLIFLAIKVIPHLIRWAKLTNDPELFLLVAIAICLGAAALAQAVGFSVALGAFLAGLSISGCEDLHDAHSSASPAARCVRRPLLRFSRNSDRSESTAEKPAAPWHAASSYRRGEIYCLDPRRLGLPLPDLNRSRRGCWFDADRRAVIRGRAGRTLLRHCRRKCLQHRDRRVSHLHLAERVYRARHLQVARPETPSPERGAREIGNLF